MGNILYNGTSYGGGGSGSEVIANPSGTPTDTLSTIQIGNDIFEIEGGGSGGGNYNETVIYENPGSSQASSMTLTDDITKYDLILFEAYVNDDNRIYTISNIYRASTIISGWSATLLRWSPSNQYINFGYVSSTELTCYSSSNMYIKRIVGLMCSNGSGGGGNTKLYKKLYNSNITATGTYTLLESIENYDFITIEMSYLSGDGNPVCGSTTANVDYIKNNYNSISSIWIDGGNNDRSCKVAFSNSTTMIVGKASVSDAITGVYGYKLRGSSGTNVEPNPADEPTDTLSTIKIGDTVFDIAGSGGGGDGYSEKTLFEQPYNTAFPSTITLSESFEDFDALGFYLTKSDDSSYYDYLPIKIFTKNALIEALNGAISGRTNVLCVTGWQHSNNSQYARFQVDSTTQLTIPVSGGAWNLKKITGIKFGNGGSGGTDISDMTWTQLISQTGGSWSAATAIPSGTEYLGIAIDHSSAVYMPKTLKLSELNKYASMLNYTIVREGIHWKHNTDQDDIYYEYDSANQTIKVYAGYSGLSVKVFAIS